MVLIRKRPDGFFERVLPDGRVDLFTLAEDDAEQGGTPGEALGLSSEHMPVSVRLGRSD